MSLDVTFLKYSYCQSIFLTNQWNLGLILLRFYFMHIASISYGFISTLTLLLTCYSFYLLCVCVRAQFACFNDCTSAHAEEQRRVRVFLEITRSVSTGGDQGVLNSFFNTWATTDISKHLPFIYNLSTVSIYSYLPAFKQSVHTFEQICSDTFVLRGWVWVRKAC